jgi:hypothetical protein
VLAPTAVAVNSLELELPFADLSGKSDAGKSYIVFGKQDTVVINLSTIVAGTGGFVINGKRLGLNQQHLRLWRQRLLCLRY